MAQMKEQITTPEKELNKMEIINLCQMRVQNTGHWGAQGTSGLSGIKKIQSETKDTLIEIKNNLQGNTIEWMKPRVKSMIWNIRNQKTTNQNNKKKKRT